MSFEIFTDTSANLPTETLEGYGIPALPLSYAIDGVEYRCTDTAKFDGIAFYAMLKEKENVSTSLVSVQAYLDAFEAALSRGSDVLYIGMSSGISGSFQSSVLAAAELRERFPDQELVCFDTRAASLGEGLMVQAAAELQKGGTSLKKTVSALNAMRPKMIQIFTVDDLTNLRRGGRISGVTLAICSVLQIKPILTGDDEGHIVAWGKVRGRKKSLLTLAEEYARHVSMPENQTVGIAHCGCPEEAAYLESLIRERRPPRDFLTVCYEPVTGSHVGPGAMALFFLGEKRLTTK